MPKPERFWEHKTLHEMTADEWESLCDRCGLCCVFKVEDDETGEVFLTNVACPLLNTKTCRCEDYACRQDVVPDCEKLTADNIGQLTKLLPPTCAYRRLAEGLSLPGWHPLVTGKPSSTATAGMSARNRLVVSTEADDLENHILFPDSDDDAEQEEGYGGSGRADVRP